MSQVVYRGNLSAKYFPFISDNWGQSVIVRGNDQDFSRQVVSQESPEKDVGIPQTYYMHNVMPTVYGFQSIGYDQVIAPYSGSVTSQSIFVVRNASGSTVYLLQDISGNIYYQTAINTWAFVQNISPNQVSTAVVNGTTYIYFSLVGCYTWDFTNNVLVSQTLTALTPTAILGVCASFGYLICWDIQTVYWSSLITPVDFTPSLTTGAGSSGIQGAKGGISICVQHTQGFIAYTNENAVACIFTGNSNYPFNFRPIVSSGGVANFSLIGFDSNTGNHYVYSTSGLQIVSTTQTQTVFPEATDFISGRVFEDFDETAMTFNRVSLSTTMKKMLNVIADRYLILSYGVTGFTHAIMYDLALKRWGKFKINHVDVVELRANTAAVVELPKQSIMFLQVDGTTKVVDFDPYISNTQGLILLGKYQYARSRMLQLEEVEVENVMNWSSFNMYVWTSLDGKNQNYTQVYPSNTSSKLGSYPTRLIGENHSIMLQGSFNVETIKLTFSVHGRR